MAFTISYGANIISNPLSVNLTTAAIQWNPQVLPDGEGGANLFYVDRSIAPGRILARHVDENGVPEGAEIVVGQGVDMSMERGTSVARLSNGNHVVVWGDNQIPSNIHYRLYDSDLNPLTPDTLAETSLVPGSHPTVTATANGGFTIAWEAAKTSADHDIVFRRFDSAGLSADAAEGIAVDSGAGYDEYPSIATLADGGLVVVWDRVVNGFSQGWQAVYNQDGSVRVAPSLFDGNGTINARLQVAAMPAGDGGYVVTYIDNQWKTDADISSARFNALGSILSTNPMTRLAAQNATPWATVQENGYVFVTNTEIGDDNTLGSLMGPDGSVLFVDQSVRGWLGSTGFGTATWVSGSRLIIADISDTAIVGGDGSDYGVSATLVEVRRTTIDDDAGTGVFLGGDAINNTIVANGGDDYIVTGDGSDAIWGGAGSDTIISGGGSDTVYGEAGLDYIVGGAGNDFLFGGADSDTIYAGDGDDYIEGGDGPSSILAGEAGNDTIYGLSGNDYMIGGDGDDVLVGLGGTDSMFGGAGADTMVAGDGPGSVVDGGAGANSLWGASGADYIVGGEGADITVGGGGSDYIFANEGDDGVYGGAGTDYLFTGAGDDFVWTDDAGGPQSTDYIYAGGGTGIDTIADFVAGAGPAHDVVVISGTPGIATFDDVLANTADVGAYAVITLGADQVWLYNVTRASLTADNVLIF